MKCTSLLCRISASLALAGALACAPALRAQQSIQLFLSAVDESGKPITDLRAEDVTIQVDGSTCTTTRFEGINWPVKLHLMVDNGPVHNDALRQLREALRLFLAELPTDMEITIVSIDPAPRFIYKAGSDRVKMLSSLDLLIPDSGAPKFIDALAEAADRVNKDKTDKNREKGNYFPVLMMVGSAGVEGSSPRDYQINKLFKQVVDNAITVHIVMQQNPNRSVDIASGTNQIEVGLRLTQGTGGRYEAINANLDASPEFYGSIITTRRYTERLETIARVRKAGITVCSGGIIGMGESRRARCGMLHQLSSLRPHPESVPINLLARVEGTPLGDRPDEDPLELVRTIATARIVMPASFVRLSAGRNSLSSESQALCFMAGANSVFLGDVLLTTPNPAVDVDRRLFAELGLRLQ